jgi:hypothetical protein
MAFANLSQAAEIAYHQGIDLYKPNVKRLAAFMELHAGLRMGATLPAGLYAGKPLSFPDLGPVYEIGYGRLVHDYGAHLPKTEALLDNVLRPVTAKFVPAPPGINARYILGPVGLVSIWMTLTNAR